MAKKSTGSWWITAGCGCAVLIALGIGAIGGVGWMGYSRVKGYVEDLEDPERRSQRARELLGAEALPEGYHGVFFVEIPWLATLVALSDDPRLAQRLEDMEEIEEYSLSDPGRHFFFYTLYEIDEDGDGPREGLSPGRSKTGGGQVNIQIEDLELISDQQLEEGILELGEQKIELVAHRGAHIDDFGDRKPGIYSTMAIGCPDGKRRVAVWFERRNPPSEGASEREIPAGSPADLEALETFMGHFELCGD